MFRFNFNVNDSAECNDDLTRKNNSVNVSGPILCPLRCIDIETERVPIADRHLDIEFSNGWKFKQSIIDHCRSKKHQTELDSIVKHSDLVPNVYEGGFKLWECSVDLVQYLIDENITVHSADILELGCGHGLPGIYASCHGANSVCFQDLNVDVLNHATSSNLILNCGLSPSIQLVAGDWRDQNLFNALHKSQYDFIFSCDTLYSTDCQPALLKVIERCLRVNGHAYIAAKSFYFGVGGSTLFFLNLIEQYPNLKASIVKTIADGQSNVRDIIHLTKTFDTALMHGENQQLK